MSAFRRGMEMRTRRQVLCRRLLRTEHSEHRKEKSGHERRGCKRHHFEHPVETHDNYAEGTVESL